MDFENLMQFLNTFGMPTAVATYFLLKDWKFTKELIATQTSIISILARIEKSIEDRPNAHD